MPRPTEDTDSDELPEDLANNSRFLALVEKRRKEREAKEAVERQKEQQRRERMKALEGVENQSEEEDDGDDEDDAHNDRQMASQPTRRRKASKKALEEMHKESQRLARNMQLEHEARTRKKITKQSLFDKFNFKAAATEEPAPSAPTPSPKLPNRSEPRCHPSEPPPMYKTNGCQSYRAVRA